MAPKPSDEHPKYALDIEGTEYSWNEDSITPAQIRELAGIPTTSRSRRST
jgi:hypothetical protein